MTYNKKKQTHENYPQLIWKTAKKRKKYLSLIEALIFATTLSASSFGFKEDLRGVTFSPREAATYISEILGGLKKRKKGLKRIFRI